MKLYGNTGVETISPQLVISSDRESYMKYHKTASVLSMESVSSFLGQVKDTFVKALSVFPSDKEEKFIGEVIGDKYQMTALMKEKRMLDIRHNVISKPESFKGMYVDYLTDLLEVGKKTVDLFDKSVPYVKTGVASFINEYSDQKEDHIYGYHKLKAAEKELGELIKTVGEYFPQSANKVKTYPPEVLRSVNDIQTLYSKLNSIEKEVINSDTRMRVKKEVENVADLVDNLIQHNLTSGVLLKNNDAKKELIECINILASISEFYSSLYVRTLTFCSAFESLKTSLKG